MSRRAGSVVSQDCRTFSFQYFALYASFSTKGSVAPSTVQWHSTKLKVRRCCTRTYDQSACTKPSPAAHIIRQEGCPRPGRSIGHAVNSSVRVDVESESGRKVGQGNITLEKVLYRCIPTRNRRSIDKKAKTQHPRGKVLMNIDTAKTCCRRSLVSRMQAESGHF